MYDFYFYDIIIHDDNDIPYFSISTTTATTTTTISSDRSIGPARGCIIQLLEEHSGKAIHV